MHGLDVILCRNLDAVRRAYAEAVADGDTDAQEKLYDAFCQEPMPRTMGGKRGSCRPIGYYSRQP